MSAVYVVAASEVGPCKIGRTRDAVRRLAILQTGNPNSLKVFHLHSTAVPIQFERHVHDILSPTRLAVAREWYAVSVLEAIAAIELVTSIPEHRLRTKPKTDRKEYLKLKARERRARQKEARS